MHSSSIESEEVMVVKQADRTRIEAQGFFSRPTMTDKDQNSPLSLTVKTMAADVKPDLRRGNRLLEGFWMISPRVRSLE